MTQEVKGFVISINGSDSFKAFLMTYNVTIGTIFTLSYSAPFFHLVNLTIGNQMLSLRKSEFQNVEWMTIE